MGSARSSTALPERGSSRRRAGNERECRARGRWDGGLGRLPAVLQDRQDGVDHGLGDVAVDAAHAGQAVPEAPSLGDFRDAVLDEPRFVAVA